MPSQNIMELGGPMAGGKMTPGGWRPKSMEVKSEGAVPVSDETRSMHNASFNSQNVAGALEHDAQKAYFNQMRDAQAMHMQASQDAAAQTAAVQAERDETRRMKLAHIEELNNEANAKIDPNKSWNDRGALARILGAIGIGLGEFSSKMRGGPNTAAQIVDSQIQREVDAQVANHKIAARKANSEETLLGLHMDRFKDMDTAIHATKLGLYDRAAAAADQAAAERGIALTDPKWLDTRAAMFAGRANVLNDMDKQEMGKQSREYHEAFAPPTMGMGKHEDFFKQTAPGSVVPIPPSSVIDGKPNPGNVKFVRVHDPATATHLQKVGGAVGSLIENNNSAIEMMDRYDSTPVHNLVARDEINRRINDLALNKINVASVKDDQGVVREPEYVRAARTNVGYTGDWAKVSEDERKRVRNFLRWQNGQMYRQFGGEVKSSGDGTVVHVKQVRDPVTGIPRTAHIPTGEQFNPDALDPERQRVQE
jgi:hypothetical protein